jgi:plasmid stabilization system protein ParE
MIFTVTWTPIAEQRLATLWNVGPDRQAIAEAADCIDHLLRHNPNHHGESRDANRRVLFIPPLAVLYRVDEDDRMVQVLDVWRF